MSDEKHAPPAHVSASAHVKWVDFEWFASFHIIYFSYLFHVHGTRSLDQYREMYSRSINEPDQFWGEIAGTFYWKQTWNLLTKSNFDCKKGPISIGVSKYLCDE